MHNNNVLDFVEFIGSGVPGHSGGPVINESNGHVFAIVREGFYLSLHGGDGTPIMRAISLEPILPYLK